jgi:hypothetical protein
MAYFIGGTSGESSAFEKTIQNSAIQVLHESQGLVNMTNVVMPNQGNTYKVPKMAPISYGDYTDQGGNPYGIYEQQASITAKEVVATPAVAQTAFSKFLGWTTAFDLANNLGSELGASFAEKVDQRVTKAFVGNPSDVTSTDVSNAGFNSTQTVQYYNVTSATFASASTGTNSYNASTSSLTDGFNRVSAMAMQGLSLSDAASTTTTAEASDALNAVTVSGMIRNVINAWRKARNPGRPTIVLGPDEEQALLSELTGGAIYSAAPAGNQTSINAGLTALGDELLSTGMLRNLYGCTVIFSTFLQQGVTRTVKRGSAQCHIGAAFGPQAITTVMVKGLDISMGDKDGGLQTWITGLGYFGSGVVDQSRGCEIAIVDSYN